MKYYRLVDLAGEPEGVIIDTETAKTPPRMLKTVELSPLFDILLQFWTESDVQIDTASNSLIYLQNYITEVQYLEKHGRTNIPSHLINPNEKMPTIPLNTLKNTILSYCGYCDQSGASLQTEDLPYIWEYLWEVIRKSFFPDKTSRFSSIFLFSDIAAAKAFQADTCSMKETICSVDLLETFDIQAYDMNWLNMVPTDCTFKEMLEFANNYWSGNLTENPTMEYLFSGKYRLYRI